MNIEQFLGKKQQLKYALLKQLLSAPEGRMSQAQLMEELETSYGTLVNLFKETTQDIVTVQLNVKLQLTQDRAHAQKYYQIHVHDVTALDYLLLHYLNESAPFLLLKDVIFGQKLTIEETAKQYHLSKSTLRRVIVLLNEQLATYNVVLSMKKKLHLEGNEWGIRLFAANFLARSYGSKEWFFSCVSLQEVQNYASMVASQFVYTDNLVNDISALYLIAVSFSRKKQTKDLFSESKQKESLYIEDTVDFQQFLVEGSQFISEKEPELKEKEQVTKNQVVFTLLLLNNNLSIVQKTPHFFYQLPMQDEFSLFKLGIDLLMEIERKLPTPLTMEEHLNLSYQFSLIAYRQLFLEKVYSIHQLSIRKVDQGTIRKIFETVSNFLYEHSQLIPDHQRLVLKEEYTQILLTQVNWLRYKPIIHIYIMSSGKSEYLYDEVLLATPRLVFNVKIDKTLNEQTDLVVSDTGFTKNLLVGSFSTPIFYWKRESSENTERFYKELSRISRRKWQDMSINRTSSVKTIVHNAN
ncbi:helix-turn-helix domain-containing protein [Enterococcus sp. 5H]|uniref:helix-turn-helix domain-containing protein n=1 Tax=Enterococcus sp. 5H TaxID=1229490 RepID=UPI00230408E6|nr:helix-turn-helix domain-containing protein [Enterococcus sp. 5H]MDA9470549.1 hypothetical protein [Enterococcus sp. 5H]